MDEFQKQQFEMFGARVVELRKLAENARDNNDYATELAALKEAYTWEAEQTRIRIHVLMKETP